MKILPINTRFETQAKIKFDNQTKNQTEVGSRVNKRNFNYGYGKCKHYCKRNYRGRSYQ